MKFERNGQIFLRPTQNKCQEYLNMKLLEAENLNQKGLLRWASSQLNFNNSLTVSTKPLAEAVCIALNPSSLICFGEIKFYYLQCLVYEVLVHPKKKKMVFPLSATSTNLGSKPVMESTSLKRKKQKVI
jgi:hypothetical protein